MRIEIHDPDDPRIEVFLGLRDHQLRQRREGPGGDLAGLFIAEGDVVCERALRSGYEAVSVLIDGTRAKPLPDALSVDVPVYAAGPEVVRRVTGLGVHRGTITCFRRRPVPSPSEVLAGARNIVVLEDVNNPNNVGLIMRSAAGLGMDAVLVDRACADPLYRRSSRVAMGEAFAMPWSWIERLPRGLDVVRSHGFTIVALTPAPDAEPLSQYRAADGERIALVLGSEGYGLSEASLDQADRRVRIPMARGVDSLNVGVATAVACYAIVHG